ncbi:MAG: hypothetical protein ACPGJI_08185 [Kangiellaceae bacterium]
MKKLHFIAMSLVSSISFSLHAEEFPICKSELTKQMKRFEKTEFTVPRKTPNGKLAAYALDMEVICPWQLEADLNGDNQNDWAAIIHRNERYELIVYLSNRKKFTFQVLHEYQFFPEQTLIKLERNPKYKNNVYGSVKYNLLELSFTDESRIYSFDKDRMKVIKQYIDEVKNKESKNELEHRHKREIEELLKLRKRGS